MENEIALGMICVTRHPIRVRFSDDYCYSWYFIADALPMRLPNKRMNWLAVSVCESLPMRRYSYNKINLISVSVFVCDCHECFQSKVVFIHSVARMHDNCVCVLMR